ncbi:hypothetical protein GPECTOR_55g337 [Gonium pectorale]|uniref:Tubulin--tyrosine ligase-like protein 5 n=1 Tax=Gonium pectorale TaxID=33097 RepID=A0A150G6I3_GONPE|nr:hypothetical protein GPECTOR_55g337 [Gonium pectorale]|eukprot:KXZ45431.1 hypothetical protein GPECTOR_55g337 [Gonium pectorale]
MPCALQVVSGETQSSFLSVKGAFVPESWELYWTVRRACHSVLGAIAPPKRVNCVPGVEAVAFKQPLVRTMQEAYGEAAFEFIPRSYMLPSQYWVWRSWTQAARSPPELPWVLKANEHRGRGVRVMKQRQAQRQALKGIRTEGGSGGGSSVDAGALPAYVLVQSYVRHQFLYDSRPSYLRLWLVVTSVRPLRAYLFRGGVLVFGDRVGGASSAAAAAAGRQAAEGGRRQLLQQEQQQQADGTAGVRQKQQYEMHQVNYWTIEGEKLQPWTLAQLRAHAEASLPGDPRVWERLWDAAQRSVGMVLASASRRMRSAARGLSALEGCGASTVRVSGTGFEVLGVDFLLNSTFHPTLVEVNALPSMARLRAAPGDPAAGGAPDAAATAAAAAAAAAPFDQEKERFLAQTLQLIGVPLLAAPSSAAAAAPEPPLASVGGVLRAFVALLRPPNNETAELQAFLKTHRPNDVAAAAGALPLLRHLLCPVPASWGPAPGWPVLQEEQGQKPAAAAAGSAAGSATSAAAGRRRRRLAGAGNSEVGAGERVDVTGPESLRPRPWDLSRRFSLGTAAPLHGRRRMRSDDASAAVAATAAASATASAMAGELQPDGSGVSTQAAAAAVAGGIPAKRRRLAAAAGGEGAGAVGAAVGGMDTADAAAAEAAACRQRCYEWEVLALIADTEYELEQNLEFEPIFPMAAARDINTAALDIAAAARAAAAGGADGEVPMAGAGASTAAAAGLLNVRLGRQSGMQRFQAGLGFVQESLTAVDLDLMRSMRYMTTVPYVLASARLPYTRADAALAAYEAVRQRPGGCLAAVAVANDAAAKAGAGGSRGGAVHVSNAAMAAAAEVTACAVQLLEETLRKLCDGDGAGGGG